MAVEINEVIVIDNDKNVNVGVITATTYYGENINLTGVVTAIDANFSGNVSVGGTLTYEDVTNIDSIGLITARSGINVLAGGIDVTGVTTASSFVGDGSQLTNIRTLEATTSGTLSDGSKVIVNTDGTVSAITQTGSTAWIATLDGSGGDYGWGITYDSSGNVYVIGYSNPDSGGGNDLLTTKFDSSGTIQWQRTLGTGTANRNDDVGRMIAVDSSGNVYVIGNTNNTGGNDSMIIAKYDSSGSIQWQKTFGESTGGEHGNGISIDSSGNVFVAGMTTKNMTSYGAIVAKFDSSGNLQWQKTLDASYDQYFYDVVVDSSDNIYAGGYSGIGGYNHYLVAKYNNSGTLQWQRSFGGGNTTSNGRSITIDSSDNIYVGGVSTGGGVGVYDSILVKYNSSGTYQWQKALGTSGQQMQIYGMASDSSDNVYILGANSNNFFFAKYNSSGTLQWQRRLGRSSGTHYGYGISADDNGNIYVTGEAPSAGSGGASMMLAKLPSDGSMTGTYGGFTYAATSHTENTPSLTSIVSSLTDATGTLSSPSNANFTDQSSSLPDSITTIASLSSNLTAENFIGISDGAYSNGQTATIQLIGSVDDAQSGLTTARSYYVQNDGTLGLTPDSPSVFAGTAVSDTQLIVKG